MPWDAAGPDPCFWIKATIPQLTGALGADNLWELPPDKEKHLPWGHAPSRIEAPVKRLVKVKAKTWYPGFTPAPELPLRWAQTFVESTLNMTNPAFSISFSQGHTSKHALYTPISISEPVPGDPTRDKCAFQQWDPQGYRPPALCPMPQGPYNSVALQNPSI